MVRSAISETGCPNHINWPLNPNAAAVSRRCGPVVFADRERERGGGRVRKIRGQFLKVGGWSGERKCARDRGCFWLWHAVTRASHTSTRSGSIGSPGWRLPETGRVGFSPHATPTREDIPSSDKPLAHLHLAVSASSSIGFSCSMRLMMHRPREATTALETFRSFLFGQEIGLNESIPAYPMMFEDGGTTDLSTTANTIGIMRNGVAMYR